MSGREEKIIEVKNLVTGFGATIIHDGLDLDIYSGEVVGIVGGSGTGKSVLMRTLIGLNPKRAGSVHIFGKDLDRFSDSEQTQLEKRWGVLFQEGALFSFLTVKENVLAPIEEHTQLSRRMKDDLADVKIAMAGLPAAAAHKFPSELSGGMKKRAALARALALDPELIFLDEPTSGLDPIAAGQFDSLIRELQSQLGLTVVMITHDLGSLAASCDRVAVLAEKKVLVNAPLAQVRDHDHPWIRDYFHGERARLAFQ